MRRKVLISAAIILGTVGLASARPPPPPEEPVVEKRPAIEWSTWVRVAYGTGPEQAEIRARTVSPVPDDDDRMQGWEIGGGIDLTLGIAGGGNIRLGPWAEVRTSSDAVVGGELVIVGAPRKLDMFWYAGEGMLIVRAGGNREVRTAAVSYGYRAPWNLFRPARGTTRYMIGVRMVGSITQSLEDEGVWSATLGLETEPVGALRYLLGIKSWY
jgi:hypothetical protein